MDNSKMYFLSINVGFPLMLANQLLKHTHKHTHRFALAQTHSHVHRPVDYVALCTCTRLCNQEEELFIKTQPTTLGIVRWFMQMFPIFFSFFFPKRSPPVSPFIYKAEISGEKLQFILWAEIRCHNNINCTRKTSREVTRKISELSSMSSTVGIPYVWEATEMRAYSQIYHVISLRRIVFKRKKWEFPSFVRKQSLAVYEEVMHLFQLKLFWKMMSSWR